MRSTVLAGGCRSVLALNGFAQLDMKRILAAMLVLVVVEALTFYAYSLLWLAEGQPQRAGDPQLRRWAFVCIAAMVIEPLLAIWWLARSRRRGALSERIR